MPGYQSDEEDKFDPKDVIRESNLGTVQSGNDLVLKGNLLKVNWYGNKQLRFFELYRDGRLKYYADMKDFKGCIQLGSHSMVRKTKKTTITLNCNIKKKEYTLL